MQFMKAFPDWGSQPFVIKMKEGVLPQSPSTSDGSKDEPEWIFASLGFWLGNTENTAAINFAPAGFC